MKHTNKLLSLSMGLILTLVSLFTSPATLTACAEEDADADLKLYAQSAVLMDADSGRILYEKDGRRIMPMASTTKIMTCILALEYGSPQGLSLILNSEPT
ncbi:MAG: hypothetical protein K2G19_12120, partial [Lachnospiraceae bacterium]|nr:hypothetical protein [Lachnospiraceae bacterium]